jgi:hypothetical protein
VESWRYGDPAKRIKFEREKGKGMKRDFDEVEHLLDLWADWMRKPEGLEEPEIAVGFMKGTLKDSEELYEASDQDRMVRANAAFDSLAPLYKQAILEHYGLGSRVWRFAKEATFEDAKIMIRVKFVAKGLL